MEGDTNNCQTSTVNKIGDIPIFTEQFIEHNKKREAELRTLKKMTTDCEENNAMLEKHINDINSEIEQLDEEIKSKKLNNAALYNHLNILRNALFQEFQSFPLPGTNECPTLETIEVYIQKLAKYKLNNSKEVEIIKQKINKILQKCN